jgi:sulfur relay protein TusB/DsrH
MSTLHTLNASAQQHSELCERLLRCSSTGDAILLLSDGTYNLSNTSFLDAVKQKKLPLYAMTNDIQARGLQRWENHAQRADDGLFVTLSCQYSKVVSWFP